MSESKIDVYAVVKKLLGPIDPVGAEHIDVTRLENLKQLTNLVDKLVRDIDGVACMKDRVEYSIKAAGEHASDFLTWIINP